MICYVSGDADLDQVARVAIFLLALAVNLWIGRWLLYPGRSPGRSRHPRAALWGLGPIHSCLAFFAVTLLIWMAIGAVVEPIR